MFFKSLAVKTVLAIQFAICICAAAANAQQVTQEDVRGFIAEGDVSGLETALAAQKDAVVDGVVTQDAQRDTYLAFSTTDPRMHRFVRAWLKEKPNSLYALTAQTWMDYNTAWFVRGKGVASETYFDAMRAFSHLMTNALQNALKANTLDKHYVPASDAILRLSLFGGLPRPVDEYLAEIMEVAPNAGSLHRGLTSTHRGWGGRWEDAEQICDTYAQAITEFENYTPRICKLYTAFWGYHNDRILPLLAKNIDDLNHPAIKEYRAKTAVYVIQGNDDFDKMARAHVSEPEFDDVDLAEKYDRSIAARHGWPSVSYDIYKRARRKAETRLAYDPYNPDLLDLLTRRSVGRSVVPDQSNFKHRAKLLRRRLVFQPFNGQVWHDWMDMESIMWQPEDPFVMTPLLANAIVYSNHSPHLLDSAMEFYFAYIDLRSRLAGSTRGVSEAERLRYVNSRFGQAPESDLVCPFIRAHRVWGVICEYNPQDSACQLVDARANAYQVVLEDAAADNICLVERAAPIEDMFYTPVQVDLGHPPLRIEGLRIQ